MDAANVAIGIHASTEGTSSRPVLWRSGPVSRLYRLGLAVLLGWTAVDVLTDGLSGFSLPGTLRQPGFWIITAFAVYGTVAALTTVFGAKRGRRLSAGLAVILTVGIGAAVVGQGAVWAAPTTWLIFGLDLVWLFSIAIALVISIVIGTPGCEVGAVQELAQRIRGTFDPTAADVHSCAAGLRRLDQWETRQAWRTSRQPTQTDDVDTVRPRQGRT